MSVLSKDAWQYVDLWLRRRGKVAAKALVYWEQAQHFFKASESLPPVSSPLTSYYCFLNAVKTLLMVKDQSHTGLHGIKGTIPEGARRNLENESVSIQKTGILSSLSKYLGESEPNQTHTLRDILANLPFIHRAYCLTYRSQRDRFIPLKNARYVKKDGSTEAWSCAEISKRFSDGKVLKTLPPDFELDIGVSEKFVIRRKKRFRWYIHGANRDEKQTAIRRFTDYHRQTRKSVIFISSSMDLWYIKRNVAGARDIDRYTLTLIFAAMHRLSELARYDPGGLARHLSGKANWLLTEFIETAPRQFLDEIASEITGLEFRVPGIRS